MAMDFWQEWLPYSMGKSKLAPSGERAEKIKAPNGSIKQWLVYYQDYVILNKRAWTAISSWYPGLGSIRSQIIQYPEDETAYRMNNFDQNQRSIIDKSLKHLCHKKPDGSIIELEVE